MVAAGWAIVVEVVVVDDVVVVVDDVVVVVASGPATTVSSTLASLFVGVPAALTQPVGGVPSGFVSSGSFADFAT